MPTLSKFSIFTVFILFLHLHSFINGRELFRQSGNRCEFYSATWKRPCFNTNQCDSQRREESAHGGYCDPFRCSCIYTCSDFCETLSLTWKGPCLSDSICSKQCREKDNKFRGYCPDFRCWCVFPKTIQNQVPVCP